MTSSGFIKIYRSLFEHPAWKSAKMKYRAFFMELLARVVWKETPYCINGNMITLKPGEYCSSMRRMVEDFNPQEIKGNGSDDKLTKNDVEGAIKYFVKANLIRKLIRYQKCILTIQESVICDEEKITNQTVNQTVTRRYPDTKEEYKEVKKNNILLSKPSKEDQCNIIYIIRKLNTGKNYQTLI